MSFLLSSKTSLSLPRLLTHSEYRQTSQPQFLSFPLLYTHTRASTLPRVQDSITFLDQDRGSTLKLSLLIHSFGIISPASMRPCPYCPHLEREREKNLELGKKEGAWGSDSWSTGKGRKVSFCLLPAWVSASPRQSVCAPFGVGGTIGGR